MSNLATRSVKKPAGNEEKIQTTHYIVAKSSGDTDEKRYLNFFTNEGQYGDMISVTVREGFSLEKFIEWAAFVQEEVESGNKVYLNFNESKRD